MTQMHDVSDLIKGLLKLFLMFAIFFGLGEYFFRSAMKNRELEKEKEAQFPARFEKVSELVLEYRPNQNWTGTVYRDRKTDIEYLYIWDGAANGGPAITRLWKEGE